MGQVKASVDATGFGLDVKDLLAEVDAVTICGDAMTWTDLANHIALHMAYSVVYHAKFVTMFFGQFRTQRGPTQSNDNSIRNVHKLTNNTKISYRDSGTGSSIHSTSSSATKSKRNIEYAGDLTHTGNGIDGNDLDDNSSYDNGSANNKTQRNSTLGWLSNRNRHSNTENMTSGNNSVSALLPNFARKSATTIEAESIIGEEDHIIKNLSMLMGNDD